MADNHEVWPHAPPHHLEMAGVFMITGSTYLKAHHFRTRNRLDMLERGLLTLTPQYGWTVHAWAVFSNHYHVIAQSPENPKNLSAMMLELHSRIATWLNKSEKQLGRQVWYNFWETALTFEKSYLARLNYVNQNPVRHGLANIATDYEWCSARWFEGTAPEPFQRSVARFKTDKVKVYDPFDPIAPED